jgi:hypothetical protein
MDKKDQKNKPDDKPKFKPPTYGNMISSLGRSSSNKNSPRQPKEVPIPMNYKILGVILFLIIFLGMIIFYMNPYNILNYIQIPIIIFYIFVIFCVLIFIEMYTKDSNVIDKDSFSEMQIRFTDFIKSYFYYIAMFLVFSVITYYLFSYFKNGVSVLLNASLPLTLGLVILTLALFSNYSKNNTIDNPILDLIKDIVMYIPCLLTDAIDFIKKDYDNTPSSVLIVFVILVFYCITFYISPMVKKEMYKNDGVFLIEKPGYLNKNQINFTTQELKDKVYEAMPFYDRWIQNMLYTLYENDLTIVYSQDASNTDISYNINIQKSSYNLKDYIVPPDKKTQVLYENFTSLMNQDTMGVTQGLNSLSQMQNSLFSMLSSNDPNITEELKRIKDKPDQIKAYIKSVILNEPYLLTFVQKLGLVYASGLSARDAFLMTLSDSIRPMSKEKYSYRYSLSMWVYFNKIEKTPIRQVIMSYGSLPSLFYDSNDSTLSLEYKDYSNNKNGAYKVLYKTKNVLYQRWNHIVVTYSHGMTDIFINNNLVGSYKNVAPLMHDDDLLVIGTRDNKNIGGICNVKYYPTPLTASKIESIYKQFNNKDPPI